MALLFDLAAKQELINNNEKLMNEANFWDDQKRAQRIIKETNQLKKLVDTHNSLNERLDELSSGIIELADTFDSDLNEIIQEEYSDVMKKFEEFEIQVLLSGEYDNHNAILEIHPGAGGTEAMDWAMMLYRMYMRYCEKKGYKITLLDYQDGEEAGAHTRDQRSCGQPTRPRSACRRVGAVDDWRWLFYAHR